jgi:hypothetical protein
VTESSAEAHTRRARVRAVAAARGVPLATINVTVAIVAATYLTGKLIYRPRDIVLIVVIAGFIALLLSPWCCTCRASGSGGAVWPSPW